MVLHRKVARCFWTILGTSWGLLAWHLRVLWWLPAPRAVPMARKVYLHRGGWHSTHAENSINALHTAALQGAQGVEVDIWLTKDTVPVVFHSARLEDGTTGYGPVGRHTLVALKRLRLTVAGRPTTSSIPTLAQVLELCLRRGMLLDIEIKNEPRMYELAQKVVELIQQYRCYDKVLVSSFYPRALSYLRKLDRRIVRGLLLPHTPTFRNRLLMSLYRWRPSLYYYWLPRYLQVHVVCPERSLLTTPSIQSWRQAGFEVLPWTVNEEKEKKWLQELGLGYITDRLL